MMEDDKYWQRRAAEMRERASRIKDPFISGGFLALAEQYEQLAAGAAQWLRAHSRRDSDALRGMAKAAVRGDALRS